MTYTKYKLNATRCIYLLGFMGCGKSTVGNQLAENLNIPFLDFDDYIEAGAKMSISEIFKIYGEPYFRSLETDNLLKLSSVRPILVSLGGGTPCSENNIGIIRQNALSIYLSVEPEELVNRLFKERMHRPLISAYGSKKALKDFIISKLNEREKYYKQADILIDANKPVSEIIKAISEIIK